VTELHYNLGFWAKKFLQVPPELLYVSVSHKFGILITLFTINYTDLQF